MDACFCFCYVRFSFSLLTKGLAGKNISEMGYFVSGEMETDWVVYSVPTDWCEIP